MSDFIQKTIGELKFLSYFYKIKIQALTRKISIIIEIIYKKDSIIIILI